MSEVGDSEGLLQVGVVTMWLRELDLEEGRVGRVGNN